jgi:hypothetical protein
MTIFGRLNKAGCGFLLGNIPNLDLSGNDFGLKVVLTCIQEDLDLPHFLDCRVIACHGLPIDRNDIFQTDLFLHVL